jgi:hypothetical protein
MNVTRYISLKDAARLKKLNSEDQQRALDLMLGDVPKRPTKSSKKRKVEYDPMDDSHRSVSMVVVDMAAKGK